eukprot:747952-Hanusia_phi.AAC.3
MDSDVKILALREEHSKIVSEMQTLARKIQLKLGHEDAAQKPDRKEKEFLPSPDMTSDQSPADHHEFSIALSQINNERSETSPQSTRDSKKINLDFLKRTMKSKLEDVLNSMDTSNMCDRQISSWADQQILSSNGWKVHDWMRDDSQTPNKIALDKLANDRTSSYMHDQYAAKLKSKIANLEKALQISRQDSNFQAQELRDCERRLNKSNAMIARQQTELNSLRRSSDSLKMLNEKANKDIQSYKKEIQSYSSKALQLESDLNTLSIRFSCLYDEKMELQNGYFLCREELRHLKEQKPNLSFAVNHHSYDAYTSIQQEDEFGHAQSSLSEEGNRHSNIGMLILSHEDDSSERQLSLQETVRAHPQEFQGQNLENLEKDKQNIMIENCKARDAKIEELNTHLLLLGSEHSSFKESLICDVKHLVKESMDIHSEMNILRLEWSSQLDAYNVENFRLKSELQSLRSEAVSVRDEKDALEAHLKDCRGTLDSSCSELTELRQRDLQNAMKVTFLHAELESCKHQLESHRNDVQRLQDELVKAEQVHTGKSREIYDLKVEKESLCQELYDLRANLFEKNSSLEKLQSESYSQAHQKTIAEGSLNEVKAHLMTARAENKVLEQKYHAACRELAILHEAQNENKMHLQTIELLHAQLEAQQEHSRKLNEAIQTASDTEGAIERLLNLYQGLRLRNSNQERSFLTSQEAAILKSDEVVENLCDLQDVLAQSISHSILLRKSEVAGFRSVIQLCITEHKCLLQEFEKMKIQIRKDEAARLELEENGFFLEKQLRRSEHDICKLEAKIGEMTTNTRLLEENLTYLLSSKASQGEYDAAVNSTIVEYDKAIDQILTHLNKLQNQGTKENARSPKTDREVQQKFVDEMVEGLRAHVQELLSNRLTVCLLARLTPSYRILDEQFNEMEKRLSELMSKICEDPEGKSADAEKVGGILFHTPAYNVQQLQSKIDAFEAQIRQNSIEHSEVERRWVKVSLTMSPYGSFRLEEEKEKVYKLKQQVTSYKWELVEAVRRAEMAERELRDRADKATTTNSN